MSPEILTAADVLLGVVVPEVGDAVSQLALLVTVHVTGEGEEVSVTVWVGGFAVPAVAVKLRGVGEAENDAGCVDVLLTVTLLKASG